MSQPLANCPNCGAPVQFRWSSAVQTVCPFCHSILVRDDLDLKNVGQVADLPPDPSPISLLTEGTYKGKTSRCWGASFMSGNMAAGTNGTSCFRMGPAAGSPTRSCSTPSRFWSNPAPASAGSPAEVSRGGTLHFNQIDYEVATMTARATRASKASCRFPFTAKSDMLFADLRTAGRAFGTLDYSDRTPLLFLGEWVEFEELQLKNLRQFEGWAYRCESCEFSPRSRSRRPCSAPTAADRWSARLRLRADSGVPAMPDRARRLHAAAPDPAEDRGSAEPPYADDPAGIARDVHGSGTQWEAIGFQTRAVVEDGETLSGKSICCSIPIRASAISPSTTATGIS